MDAPAEIGPQRREGHPAPFLDAAGQTVNHERHHERRDPTMAMKRDAARRSIHSRGAILVSNGMIGHGPGRWGCDGPGPKRSLMRAASSIFRAYRICALAIGSPDNFISSRQPLRRWERTESSVTMSWTRRLPTSVRLGDGRTLTTLAQARDLLLARPRVDQASSHWRSAGELLLQAAHRGRKTSIFDAGDQFSRALHVDGLL